MKIVKFAHNITLIALIIGFVSCTPNDNHNLFNPADIIGEWRYYMEYGNSESAMCFMDSTVYDCSYIYGKVSYNGAELRTYSINHDSLLIKNGDWGAQTFKIIKLTSDSLVLQLIRQQIYADSVDEWLDNYEIDKYIKID